MEEKKKPETDEQTNGASELNGLLYVLAGDYQQAVFYAKERGMTRDRLRDVSNDRDLRGIDGKGKNLYIYGTAYRRDRYREIINVAIGRGFNVKHV